MEHAHAQPVSCCGTDGCTCSHPAKRELGFGAKVRPYRRLILMLSGVTIASAVWGLTESPWWHGFMQYFMGLYFLAFGISQTLSLKQSAKMFQQYDPIAKRIHLYGYLLPLIQIGLGIAYLMWAPVYILSFVTIAVVGINLIGVGNVLDSEQTVRCGCLGKVIDVPVGWVTFTENFVMLLMASAMIVLAQTGIHNQHYSYSENKSHLTGLHV